MKKNIEIKLIRDIEQHVPACFKNTRHSDLQYHNAVHIRKAAESASTLCDHYQLNERDHIVVMAAVWFHDLGYLTCPENHEQASAMLAEKYLLQKKVDPETIDVVKKCILATKIPQTAVTLVEQIVCDADQFDLGTANFAQHNKLLRKEWILLNKTPVTKNEWRKKTVSLFERHSFYTKYCKEKLDSQKARNLSGLKRKIAESPSPQKSRLDQESPPILTEKNNQPAKHDKVSDKPEKGIETMFRISSGNHQRLSDMADKKAHIMITVNSIILSAVISLLLRKLDTYVFLIIPSFILLLVSLAAMTFSILSTRPSVPRGTFEQTELDNRKVNLLFFGNFYKMRLQQFEAGMKLMMEDGQFLYGSLIRDVYAQGVVLGKKYHLLRISYNLFMYGAIVAVGAFMIACLLNGNAPHNPQVSAAGR